jgi:hypothetical protein
LKGGRVRPPLIELSREDREDLEVLMEKIGAPSVRGVTV